MYAFIKTGGKQYKAIKGRQLKIEKLEKEVNDTVEFNDLVFFANKEDVILDKKELQKKKVLAKVVAQKRAKKIHVIKFRRRKHSKKQSGHRQYFTQIEITDII